MAHKVIKPEGEGRKHAVIVPEAHEGDNVAEAVDELAAKMTAANKRLQAQLNELITAVKAPKNNQAKFRMVIRRDDEGYITEVEFSAV